MATKMKANFMLKNQCAVTSCPLIRNGSSTHLLFIDNLSYGKLCRTKFYYHFVAMSHIQSRTSVHFFWLMATPLGDRIEKYIQWLPGVTMVIDFQGQDQPSVTNHHKIIVYWRFVLVTLSRHITFQNYSPLNLSTKSPDVFILDIVFIDRTWKTCLSTLNDIRLQAYSNDSNW